MDRRLPFPIFQGAPKEYDQKYSDQFSNSLNILTTVLSAAGEGRNTQLVLTALTTNDKGLEAGKLFQVDGFVKIVRLFNPHVEGLSSTMSIGSVTIVIS